jgi:glycosyltransferase involved in cell wall biosynthesis
MVKLSTYVLVTPARNEAQFIELTIKSVVSQMVRPLKWVIVSDGSTDGTDDIVSKYAAEYPWIELVRTAERRDRHFAGKADALNAGYARIKHLKFEVIGSLDGDISFDEEYFLFLLYRLSDDPVLGLVGTPFTENSHRIYNYRIVGTEHVSGACQLFRRECFEDIGGYVPVKDGGVDQIAVMSARMKGWKTRTFTEKVCVHHRVMGTAERGVMMARFRSGVKDYAYGGHPLWECIRALYQMSHRPYIFGGLFLGAGYIWSMVRRAERPISREMVDFRRRDQMRRLKRILTEELPKVSWGRSEKTVAVDGGGNSISTRSSAGRS